MQFTSFDDVVKMIYSYPNVVFFFSSVAGGCVEFSNLLEAAHAMYQWPTLLEDSGTYYYQEGLEVLSDPVVLRARLRLKRFLEKHVPPLIKKDWEMREKYIEVAS